MNERFPCRICGALILGSTAERTGGLCMPCKGGYRASIEARRHGRARDHAVAANPQAQMWAALLHQVRQDAAGIDGLNHPQQLYYASSTLLGAVLRGGMQHYFAGAAADHYKLAQDGLMAMGATRALRLLLDARKLLFGPSLPNEAARRERLYRRPLFAENEARSAMRLNALNAEFSRLAPDLEMRLNAYAHLHGLLGR
ncbi:DUF4375 domain-containing protein [Massilia sp. erpn]|uniref:DMP19 family protein n=1 Tax=Massilia sp. erpn TaxID=2738142 RepID=UPI002105B3BD|nr:DUF4375 domain-containing protein [Massilia sp. erpn]UTY60495.1 DUF4375 domain-containing protein [Massilia sp. erpn]